MRSVVVAAAGAIVGGALVAGSPFALRGEAQGSPSIAAVAGQKGGWDLTGPYDVVRDWPKPLSNLPGHQGWTWGSAQGVFAESPNRVFMLMRGELPDMPRPQVKAYPEVGPSVSFPTGGVPWRNASQGMVASPPGAGGPGADPDDPAQQWRGRMGIDARWEHLMVAFNANGDIVEQWPEWDKLFKRPHAIYISPYDPQKHLWVVDDHGHAVYKFTNDGKKLVQTLGTPGKKGDQGATFNRPTFLAFLPDGSMFVADGYNGTRVVKFDKDGKYLTAWGQRGEQGKETRGGYFNVVHGIAADPVSKRVYVSDRGNRRVQVFDENGKYLDQWPTAQPSNPQFLMVPANRALWLFDDTTSSVVKYDLDGRFLYRWGANGEYPGAFFNMHGASTDQEGNLYTVEVGNGRIQKFRPRQGANSAYLIGPPAYSAWK